VTFWGAGLALALVLAQTLAWGVARGLHCKLPRAVMALGGGLALAALLPALAGRLLTPVDGPLWTNLPDAPRVADPDFAHGVYNDAVLQLLPWEAEVRRGFAEGHLPLWSDVLDGGSSPWANPQAAVLSPIAMLARLLPLAHFLLGALAVKLLLAAEGTWLLARALGARRASAALAAAGFACGGPIVAWAVFPLSSAAAWSPWLLLGVLRLVRRPTRRHVAVTALVAAALLLSGHPEIAVAEALLAAAFAAAVWRRAAGAVRPLAAAAAAAALALGLAACTLVPFALLARHSLRGEHGATAAVAGGAFSAPGEARLFASPLNPWAFGRPFQEPFDGPGNFPIAAGAYLGLVALAGAAAAVAARRRRLAAPLAAIAVAMGLCAAGFYPCRWLLARLPLGGALAVDRFLPAAALPLALLAALGLDALAGRRWRTAAAAVAIAAAASLALRHAPPILALWLLVAAGALLLHRHRPTAIALLALATLLDLGSWDRDVLPQGHRDLYFPRTPLIAAIATATAPIPAPAPAPETGTPPGAHPPSAAADAAGGASAAQGPWRAVAAGFALYPSLLPMYGVAEVRIDNPLAPAELLLPLGEIFGFRPEGRRYKSGFRHLEHPFLDFLNVRAVVLPAGATPPARFVPVTAAAGLQVLVNPRALPRFFLPIGADLRPAGDAVAALRDLRDARRVVLQSDAAGGAWQPPERAWQPAAVRVLHARRGALALGLPPATTAQLLATSLPFPAGWRATAGGTPLRRLVVDTAYLGVVIPPGATRVDLAFAPPGLRAGALASILSAAALLALFLGRPARRRPGRP
jgi:hypothetical protein